MIKFPRVHIAASVLNRILNVRDELERSSSAPAVAAPTPPPAVPDPTLEGAVLDARTMIPPQGDLPPTEPQEAPTDELTAAVARGDDLIGA